MRALNTHEIFRPDKGTRFVTAIVQDFVPAELDTHKRPNSGDTIEERVILPESSSPQWERCDYGEH